MDARATREDCTKVAEHIADLVIADALANPDRLWESAKAAPDGGGVPATITQDQFKTWLDSPEGKTWMMARRGQTLASAQQGVEGCVAEGTRADTRCLLAAKTRADVLACDEASQKRRGSRPEASGSATGSGEPTTGSAAAGSAATGSAATGAAPTGSAATGSAATGSATGSAP